MCFSYIFPEFDALCLMVQWLVLHSVVMQPNYTIMAVIAILKIYTKVWILSL